MSKAYAKMRAEEKKKSSSASSQKKDKFQQAYEQGTEIYNQNRQNAIQDVRRLQQSLDATSGISGKTVTTARTYLDNLAAYRARLASLGMYGYDVARQYSALGGAAQMAQQIRGMSQAQYLQDVRFPQKYAGQGIGNINLAIQRLSNGNAQQKAEAKWLKQHRLDFVDTSQLQRAQKTNASAIERMTADRNQYHGAARSNWYDKNREQYDAVKAASGQLNRAIYERTYGDLLEKMPTALKNDLINVAGKAQAWEGETTEENRKNAQGYVQVRNDLKKAGYTDDQIAGLMDYARRQYNATATAADIQKWADRIDGGFWNGAGASAASVPMNLAGGVAGYLDMAGQRLLGIKDPLTGTRKPIDYNSGANRFSNVSSGIRAAVGEHLNGFQNFLYQTGMSMGDFGLAALTGQAEILLAGSAAQQATQEAHLRGASDDQALFVGLLSGAAEAAFEHLSIENLRGIKNAVNKGMLGGKFLARAVGMQSLTEGSEEGLTTIANLISDAILMGDESQVNQQIRENILNGMSEKDATVSAWTEQAKGLLMDVAGGMLSGALIGGAQTGISAARFGAVNRSMHTAQQTPDFARYGAQARAVQSVYEAGEADAETFLRQFETAYNLGREGANIETAMNTPATAGLNEQQRRNAWLIGRDVGVRAGEITEDTSGTPGSSSPTEIGGVQNNGEAIRVRGSSERDAGASALGSVQQVESGTGSYQEGRSLGIGESSADSAAQTLRYSSEVKSARDLGIGNGAVIQNLRTVDETSYTPEMKEYADEQAEKGHRVVYLSGMIHAQDAPGGMVTRSRGMVNTNGDIFVQVDHPRFTAMQIARHEDAHTRIQRGEIDLQKAKDAVRQSLGEEEYKRAVYDYASAYAGIDMTDDEAFEEIVCDAEGGMNIFEGTALKKEYDRNARITEEARKAVRENAGEQRADGTRAPPESGQKMSRDDEAAVNAAGISIDEENGKEEFGGKQKFSRELDEFTSKDEIDAEIERLQDQIRDIQNARWSADEHAKKDPRVIAAQERAWKAEDEKGRAGSLRERVEYKQILKQVKEELNESVPEGDVNELAQRVTQLKELREQFLQVTIISEAQYQKLVDHFGTTDDYDVAGFILKDGHMLDFSGRRQYGRAYAGGREVYHNEVGDVLNLPTDTSPRIDMVSNGNIRLVPEINGINLAVAPTAEQEDTIRGFVEHNGGSVHVDIDNYAGRTIETFGYRSGTSASKILSDIRSYFKTGQAPEAQSDLLSFYTENRYSREDNLDVLRKENRELKRETDALTKAVQKWKRETKRTERYSAREEDVRRSAKDLIKTLNSTADAAEITADMKALAEYIMNGENGEAASWLTVREMADRIADKVVGAEQVNIRGDVFNEYQRLTEILKGKTLHIDPEAVPDLQGYENLLEFNRANMGTMRLTAKEMKPGDKSVQDAYYEMIEAMPGWFPEDASTDAEMVANMLEVLDGLRPVYGMSDETSYHYDEAVTWAANDIIDRVLDESIRQMPKTFADRAQAKLDKERARLYQRIREVRAQGNERVERTKREYTERSRKAIERMQARQEREIQKLKDRQREVRQNERERRGVTATWHKIQKIGAKFRQMAEKPAQAASKHAPIRLARALQGVAESFQFENRRMVPAPLDKVFKELQVAYQAMEDENDPNHIYYDKDLYSALVAVKTDVEGYATTGLTGIDQQQLQSVYNLLRMFEHTITNANKFVHGQWLIGKIEAGLKLAREIADAAPLFKKGVAGRVLNLQLRPDSFFARLSGFAKNGVGEQIQKMFVEGEERMLRIQQDAYQHFSKFTESKEFAKLSSHKKGDLVDVGLKSEDGKPILLTRDLMLAVYMHLRSEDNLMGAAYGGFDVPDVVRYYRGDTSESFTDGIRTSSIDERVYELREQLRDLRHQAAELETINEANAENIWEKREEIEKKIVEIQSEIQAHEGEMIGTLLDVRARIGKMLTQYERDLIDAADAWMQKSADYINEETRAMYGIEKANVEHYWPIHRNKAFVNTELRDVVSEINLENVGFLNERVKSHAPVMLTGLAFELDNHTRRMSQFCGFAAAQRDFQQIYSTRLPGMHSTLAEQIDKKFGGDMKKLGTSGREYIEKYINDISGAKSTEKRSPLAPVRQNLARATLSVNFRVAMSQVASIPTAAAEVGWGAMAKGYFRSSVKGLSAKQQAKLAAADPWFWQRSRGEGGMREFAEMRESNNALDRGYNKIAGTKVGKAILNWCQRFDMYATYSQWTMAEEWVKKHTDLKPDTEEFDSAVSAKYRDIIRKTQPNYTVTERSDLLRDTRESMKWATMYKTQSNQNLNILYEATARLHQYNRDLKAGKNGVTEEDVREARRAFANAYTGVILGGTVSFVLFRAFANALIHAMNGYRDDDDELTVESFLKGVEKETFGAMAGMFVLGSEIYDAVYALVTKGKYWGLTDSAVGALDDVLQQAVKVAQKVGTDNPPTRDDWVKLANSIMAPLGIPGKNAAQIVSGIVNHIEDIQNGEFLSFEAGVNRTAGQETNRILNGYLNGEGDKVKRAWGELVELKGGDESKAQETMRDGIKEAYMDGKITDKQVLDMLKRYGGKDGDDGKEYLLKWQSIQDVGVEPSKIDDAYRDGEISKKKALSALVKYKQMTQEEAQTALDKADFAEKYGFAYSEANVQQAVADGDMTPDEALAAWKKFGNQSDAHYEKLLTQAKLIKQYPNVDPELIGTQSAKDYEDFGKAAEIPAEDFFRYWQDMYELDADKYPNGDSIPYTKMRKVAEYVSNLPISPAQKTEMYRTYFDDGKISSKGAKYITW